MLGEGSWRENEGFDAETVGSLFGVNADKAADNGFTVTQLWLQRHFLNHKLQLRLGKLDLTGSFQCRVCPVTFDGNLFANSECCLEPTDSVCGTSKAIRSFWIDPEASLRILAFTSAWTRCSWLENTIDSQDLAYLAVLERRTRMSTKLNCSRAPAFATRADSQPRRGRIGDRLRLGRLERPRRAQSRLRTSDMNQIPGSENNRVIQTKIADLALVAYYIFQQRPHEETEEAQID